MSDGQKSGQKGGMWRRLFGGRAAEEQAPEIPETEAPGTEAVGAEAPNADSPVAGEVVAPVETTDAPAADERAPDVPAMDTPADAPSETPVADVADEAAWPEDAGSDDAQRPVSDEVPDHAAPALPAETSAEEPASGPESGAAPETEPDDALTAKPETRQGFFRRLLSGLDRTSSSLTEGVTGLFTKRKLDAETLQDLEDVLIQADLGVETAMAVTDRLSDTRYQKGIEADALRQVLAEEVSNVLEPVEAPFAVDASKKPFVVLVVGVNGTGKTTTIGKIAAKLRREGKSVMLAAGDTFRAAAVEQLKIWGERTKSPVVARPTGSDASGLVFDAMEEAAATSADVLMIDTAGRLQNRAELMAELEKVVRVIRKKTPDAPHAVLLVLDATTGQNALNQVEIFGKAVGVTGLVMTKLDGTARGGILVAIAARHKVPVHFVGVGEGIDDLAPFSARDFAAAIAGLKDGV
ncbi:signal recognition particle-docking protein FtsY [Amorphus coralli]|uniref:signal recognition particle-docking protein FtsY n=1 Tax=Amorphus coralli TaxID=340680 RepID=UPI000380C3C8|nr:signal recognition particle-docking protein FtsY [Amorphus coralli]